MARRLFDMICAAVALVILFPVLLGAWIGVRLASPGDPPLFRTRRIGLRGRAFTMYKFRTMHGAAARGAARGPRITGVADARVFPLGRLLRKTKIDELPQLWNIIRGDMALVGPRPEDPDIVRQHYAPVDYQTLAVRPGLASPGSLYQYAHGDALLADGGGDPERNYVERLLPIKLTLDRVYVRRATWRYDLAIIARTVRMIVYIVLGVRRLPEPPELAEARRLLPERTRTTRRRAPRVEPPVIERA